MSTFRCFEFELEDVLLVMVYERWTSRAVGISDSAQLHIIIKPNQVRQLLPFQTLGSGTSRVVVSKFEKFVDRGRRSAALGKKFKWGITRPLRCTIRL